MERVPRRASGRAIPAFDGGNTAQHSAFRVRLRRGWVVEEESLGSGSSDLDERTNTKGTDSREGAGLDEAKGKGVTFL